MLRRPLNTTGLGLLTKHLNLNFNVSSLTKASFSALRYFSTSGNGDNDNKVPNTDKSMSESSILQDRGEQARDAMKDYIKRVSQSNQQGAQKENLWQKLRKELGAFRYANEKFSRENNQSAKGEAPIQAVPPPRKNDRNMNEPRRTEADAQNYRRKSNDSGGVGRSAQDNRQASPPPDGRPLKKSYRISNNRFKTNSSAPRRDQEALMEKSIMSEIGASIERRRNLSEDDEEGEDNRGNSFGDDEPLPEAVQSLLLDHEYFASRVAEGAYEIDEEDMDEIDVLLSRGFLESFKTKSGSFETLILPPGQNRVIIPQPRSLLQLQKASLPRISAPVDSLGYELAAKAWTVLAHNCYYTERQKRDICNNIAVRANLLLQKADAVKDSDVDMIHDPTFRKGLTGIEKEEREKMLRMQLGNSNSDLNQSEPNWDQEAVEDEDQLFK